jgi:nucleotide-binding universal stress UspA family protein
MPAAAHEIRRLLVHRAVTSNRPLLIGYDGSEEAGHAIDVAAALLKPTEAVVLNVAPVLTPGESFVTVGSPVSGAAAFEGLNKDDSARQAEAGARLAHAAGLQAAARVCVAAPRWQGIVETALDIDAAAIVLGVKHRRHTSREVAQHAGRPLLVVGPRVGKGPILIANDGSEHARRAIEAAHALVREGKAVVVEAAPLEVADEIDASLIVVGSRGLTGAREVVEHSVSHDVARHADRPVLLVPPYSSR